MVVVTLLPLATTGSIYLLLIEEQGSITFDSEMRQGILFEDRNFSNSKKYFWALQCLQLFAEHIEGTLRSIPNIFISMRLADFSLEDYETVKSRLEEIQTRFGKLRDRIERKRREIQGLRDGVCQVIQLHILGLWKS